MDEPQNICPKCQNPRTEFKDGLVFCPNCGFEGEPRKQDWLQLAASIYCGIWLAQRSFTSFGLRVLFSLIFVVGIGAVNFIIICAGCTPNLIRG